MRSSRIGSASTRGRQLASTVAVAWSGCLLGCVAPAASFETSSAPPAAPDTGSEEVKFELDAAEPVEANSARVQLSLVERFFLGVRLRDRELVDSTLTDRALEDGREFLEAVARPGGGPSLPSTTPTVDYSIRGSDSEARAVDVDVRSPMELQGRWSFRISSRSPLRIDALRRHRSS